MTASFYRQVFTKAEALSLTHKMTHQLAKWDTQNNIHLVKKISLRLLGMTTLPFIALIDTVAHAAMFVGKLGLGICLLPPNIILTIIKGKVVHPDLTLTSSLVHLNVFSQGIIHTLTLWVVVIFSPTKAAALCGKAIVDTDESSKNAVIDLTNDKNNLEENLRLEKEKNDKANLENVDLKNQIDNQNNALDGKDNEIQTLKNEKDLINAEKEQALKDVAARVNDIQILNAEKTQLQHDLDLKDPDIQTLRDDNQSLKDRVTILENDLALKALSIQTLEAEKQLLQDAVNAKDVEIKTLKSGNAQHLADLATSAAAIQTLKDEKHQLQEDLKAKDLEIKAQVEEFAKLKQLNLVTCTLASETLENSMKNLQEKNLEMQKLEATNANQSTAIQTLETEKQQLQSENNTLKSRVSSLENLLPVPSCSNDPYPITQPGQSSDETASILNDFTVLQDRDDLHNVNFMTYMKPFIKWLCTSQENINKFKNEDTIGIQNGRIIKTTDNDLLHCSLKQIMKSLKSTYGYKLAKFVIDRYELKQKKHLTFLDLKKVMVGIAANVTYEDLCKLFNSIKKNDHDFLIKNSILKSYPQIFNKIINSATIDNLTRQELYLLYSAFTKIDFNDTNYSMLYLTEDIDTTIPSYRSTFNDPKEIYAHDYKRLYELATWSHLKLDADPTHSVGELLGKKFAYLRLRKGMIVPLPIFNHEGIEPYPQLFQVIDKLDYGQINRNEKKLTRYDAVVPYLIAPCPTQETLVSPEMKLFLVFRGTTDLRSWQRNINLKGVGFEEYYRREQEIIDMISNYLSQHRHNPCKNLTLHITGHSLGGADAQRALLSVTKKIAYDNQTFGNKINHVIATTYNAPRIEADCIIEFTNAIRTIHDKEIPLNVELNHFRYFDVEKEDLVQKFGKMLLGVDDLQVGNSLKESNIVKRRIFFIKVNQQLDIIPLHSYKFFDSLSHLNIDQIDSLSCDDTDQLASMNAYMKTEYPELAALDHPVTKAAQSVLLTGVKVINQLSASATSSYT